MTIFRNVGWGGLSAGIRVLTGLLNMGLAISLLGTAKYGHEALVVALAVTLLSTASSFFTIATSAIIKTRSAVDEQEEFLWNVQGVWTFSVLLSLAVVTNAVAFDNTLAREWVYQGPDSLYAAEIAAVVHVIAFAAACQI